MAVNFFVFAAQTSSSPCTKRFQRRTRSLAPFSGFRVHALACAAALAGSRSPPLPTAAPAATPAVAFRKSRRLMSLMLSSLVMKR